MNVIDKIEEYRKQKGWTVYKLAIEAGLSQSALSNMYARGTQPSLFTLTNICEAFGITMSQFFDDGTTETAVLSAEEKALLDEYRRMSPESKAALVETAKHMR